MYLCYRPGIFFGVINVFRQFNVQNIIVLYYFPVNFHNGTHNWTGYRVKRLSYMLLDLLHVYINCSVVTLFWNFTYVVFSLDGILRLMLVCEIVFFFNLLWDWNTLLDRFGFILGEVFTKLFLLLPFCSVKKIFRERSSSKSLTDPQRFSSAYLKISAMRQLLFPVYKFDFFQSLLSNNSIPLFHGSPVFCYDQILNLSVIGFVVELITRWRHVFLHQKTNS